MVDANGLLRCFSLSTGRTNDSSADKAFLKDQRPAARFLLGHKACGAEWIRTMIEEQEAMAIIPNRRNSNTAHAFIWLVYRLHNRVECFFRKLKHFRLIETSCEELSDNFLALVKLATICIWLHFNESTV